MELVPTERPVPWVVVCPMKHRAELAEVHSPGQELPELHVWCSRCGTLSKGQVVQRVLRHQMGKVPQDLIDLRRIKELEKRISELSPTISFGVQVAEIHRRLGR